MRVLYLSPLVPDVAGSGGKRAVFSHLEDMQRCGASVKAVMVDVEGTGEQCPECFRSFSPVVFPRALPRVGKGLMGKLIAVGQLVFGRLPRSAAVIASRPIKDALRHLIGGGDFDLVVVDHLNAYALLDDMPLSTPFLYIAHNIESEVLRDRCHQERMLSAGWVVAMIEYWKMLRFERRLITNAARIVLISSADQAAPMLQGANVKVTVWPELPSIKHTLWNYKGSNSLLFVGSTQYFPNREAILWLIQELMPQVRRIDSTVMLIIAGTSKQDLGLVEDIPGVRLAGFVSAEELNALHLACDLFICPIVIGGGIKIKLLEACSYGMPVIATKESLRGMEFLQDIVPCLRREPGADASAIVGLLNASAKLQEMQAKILSAQESARRARPFLVDA